jgi:hypothetical protein
MGSKKMTFSIPEDVAQKFVRRVPARERSKYLAQALSEKLSARERQLAAACKAANEDPEVRAIEEEFDAITDEIGLRRKAAPRRNLAGKPRSSTRARNSEDAPLLGDHNEHRK